jgi:lactoylglutathione lyase
MFNKVVAAVLFVQDFEKCLAFYRDTLGLPVISLLPKFAAFKMDDQDFAISQMSEGAEQINVGLDAFEPHTGKLVPVMLCAMVENVDTAYEDLKAKGVQFTKAPVDQPWSIRAAYFHDPEGNVWEIAHKIAPQQKA